MRTLVAAILAVGLLLDAHAVALAEHTEDPTFRCPEQTSFDDLRVRSSDRELKATIDAHLADDRLRRAGTGVSIWVEGFGEIKAVNPELRLRPASNQKLLTAITAFEVLGPDMVFATRVSADGTLANGTLEGDLYLVGGGDPTLASDGSHSLEALAAGVAAAGIRTVAGSVIGDESRYDTKRRANGWSESVIPTWVGSLSALMVDENRHDAWADFIAEPAVGNAELFRQALVDSGVAVTGDAQVGVAPDGANDVAVVTSAPLRDLVGQLLTDSNNTIAEMLIKEVGHRARGTGSTAAGLAVAAEVTARLCLPTTILQQDGSGLSHGNARSARDWRRLLQAAAAAPWWEEYAAALAVAGESGTLRSRFLDTAAEGNLRAKTGTITGIRSLSGTLVTAGGRRVFFSAVIDADRPRTPMRAIDELLVAIAEDES